MPEIILSPGGISSFIFLLHRVPHYHTADAFLARGLRGCPAVARGVLRPGVCQGVLRWSAPRQVGDPWERHVSAVTVHEGAAIDGPARTPLCFACRVRVLWYGMQAPPTAPAPPRAVRPHRPISPAGTRLCVCAAGRRGRPFRRCTVLACWPLIGRWRRSGPLVGCRRQMSCGADQVSTAAHRR